MGITTGDVTVGNIGSERAKGFTVIGDTVNLRLASGGREQGIRHRDLVSRDTWQRAQDAVEAREIDTVRVVGKTEPVRVYELLARKEASTLQRYLSGEF